MNGVVSVEAFATETSKGRHDDRLPESELAFNDGMHDGVGCHVRQPDAMPSMVVLDKHHALLLIEVQPLICGQVSIGIVLFHSLTLRQTCSQGRAPWENGARSRRDSSRTGASSTSLPCETGHTASQRGLCRTLGRRLRACRA